MSCSNATQSYDNSPVSGMLVDEIYNVLGDMQQKKQQGSLSM